MSFKNALVLLAQLGFKVVPDNGTLKILDRERNIISTLKSCSDLVKKFKDIYYPLWQAEHEKNKAVVGEGI